MNFPNLIFRCKRNLFLFWLFIWIVAGGSPLPGFAGVKDSPIYQKIKLTLDTLWVVDSHEHLRAERELLRSIPDFWEIMTSLYVRDDIINSGNTFSRNELFRDGKLSDEERWNSFFPVFERIRNTGYVRGYLAGFKKVYGISVQDVSSFRKLNQAMAEIYQPGILQRLLHDQGKIELVIEYASVERMQQLPRFFKLVRFIDDIINIKEKEQIFKLEEKYGVQIHSIPDMEKLFQRFIDESIKNGVIGFKTSISYVKSLDFTKPSSIEANRIITKLLLHDKPNWDKGGPLSVGESSTLTNALLHLFLSLIDGQDIPFVFHTGIQTWASLDIRQSDPQLLIPIFREYKNINFLLLHGGYPYLTESVELAKSWRNVYLDLCWLSIISPDAARRILSELLESVPINKFWFFGGDAFYPEQTIGQLELAKQNCSIVLAGKVEEDIFSEREVLEFAKRILNTNIKEFFKIRQD